MLEPDTVHRIADRRGQPALESRRIVGGIRSRRERVVVVNLPRLEAADTSVSVGQRKQDPPLEIVVAATVRQPDREQLLLGVALLQGARSEPRAARRVAESELAAHLLAEATRGE